MIVLLLVIAVLLALAWGLLRPTRGMFDLPEPPPGAEPDAHVADEAGEVADCGLVTIARYHFPEPANLLRGRLQADGIPAFVMNAHTTQALGYLRLAHGGVRVMVPTGLEAAAREVIQALDRGEYALDGDEENEDPGRSY
jgi:hypothetical protein